MTKKKKPAGKTKNRQPTKLLFLLLSLIAVFTFLYLPDFGVPIKIVAPKELVKSETVTAKTEEPFNKVEKKNTESDSTATTQAKAKGYAAIIIDDVGFNKKIISEFIGLEMPITFSILPGQLYSKTLAASIAKAGYETMLHIPMEPKGDSYKSSGMKMLTLSNSKDELLTIIRRQIAELPNIVGANNHMGSLFTESSESMAIVLDEINNANLFFVDSLTTPKSVGIKSARSIGLKVVARDLFLDHEIDHDKISDGIKNTIRIALKRGYSVAIGHPHKETLNVLREMKGEFEKAGVELVFVSKLVR